MVDVKPTLCLQFKISLPYSGESRRTHDYKLLNRMVWLEIERRNMHYEMSLCTGSKEPFEALAVTATTYIQHPNKPEQMLGGQQVTFKGNKCKLFVLPVKTVMEQFPLSSELQIMVNLTGITVTASGPLSDCASSQVMNLREADEQQRVDAILNLLQNTEWADVQLMCSEGQTLLAHSCILCLKSPYFAKNLKRHEIIKLNLDDVDLSTMTLVLRYMCALELPDLNAESACALSNAAERLELPGLQEKCWDWFSVNVNQENFISFLMAAHRYECNTFRDAICAYIFHHQEVLKGDLWNDFIDKNNPVIEVLQRIATSPSRSRTPS